MANLAYLLAISTVILCMDCVYGKVPEFSINELLRQNPRLTAIGRINRKHFFLGSETKSWANALAFCSGLNMELATITSSQENDFLKNNLKYGLFYWTAGRDGGTWLDWMGRRTREQFEWHSGGSLGDFGNAFHVSTSRTCIALLAGDIYGWWFGRDCSSLYSVLCQN